MLAERLGAGRAASGCCSASPTPGWRCVEWAWLAGEPDAAAEVAEELLPRMEHRGAAHFRAELLRHLARAGLPAEPFDGCPEPWASGPARRLARRGRRLGGGRRPLRAGARAGRAPASREATLEGLRILDRLGAAPAAAIARERLARARRARPAPAPGDPRQPGRAHRPPARRARAARRRAHQRGDRRAARGLRADRRPPRRRGAEQARRPLPPRRGGRGARARDRLRR